MIHPVYMYILTQYCFNPVIVQFFVSF